jgi:hypothetical protein
MLNRNSGAEYASYACLNRSAATLNSPSVYFLLPLSKSSSAFTLSPAGWASASCADAQTSVQASKRRSERFMARSS